MITPSFGAGGSPRSSTSQESFTGNMGHPPMPLPRAHSSIANKFPPRLSQLQSCKPPIIHKEPIHSQTSFVLAGTRSYFIFVQGK